MSLKDIKWDASTSGVRRITLPWAVLFLTIKWFGTSLAAWSYWWVLAACFPVLTLILGRLGLL